MARRTASPPPVAPPPPAPRARRRKSAADDHKAKPATARALPQQELEAPGDDADNVLDSVLGGDGETLLRERLMRSPQASELLDRFDASHLSDEQRLIMEQGWTPLEFLVNAYRNVWWKPETRVAAARAVLDYAHKRMPTPLQLGNDPANPLMPGANSKFDPSKLNDKELALLAALVQKAQASE